MAARIAEERSWSIGKEVGWHIRFDRRFTPETKLLVVTEGILTAYLQADPLLSEVATVVIDEFHERSVHADLGLSLVRQAWLARPDLHIVVMSATLETTPVAEFLDNCPVIEVPGALHSMTIDYAPGHSVAEALAAVLPVTAGNVLCFLPGARDIAATITQSQTVANAHGIELLPLHGSLEAQAQDAALKPANRRRVIVATNVAETSLTVPGVSAVVDSGLQKVARYDPDRGVDALMLERVTTDSADQRAGRSARLGPGRVLRLWDPRDRLRPRREAEIHRVDLSAPLLAVLCWGAQPGTFEWFERPAAERVESAINLLTRLGAVEAGAVTELGRQMQRLPLPPRLARVLIEARGSFEACAACAWLSEPTRLAPAGGATSSDVLNVLDQWNRMPAHLKRVAEGLQRVARSVLGRWQTSTIGEAELRKALLAGYPDRVARRRSRDRVTLATGHGAIVPRESGVHDGEWLIALDVTAGRTTATTEAVVRVASRIETEWLAPTRSEVLHEIDPDTGSVRGRAIDWYDKVVLAERSIAVDDECRIRLLAAWWLARPPDETSARLLHRIRFAGIDADVTALVESAAANARKLADVVLAAETLPWEARQQLTSQAPDRLVVPSGREIALDYQPDGTVSMSVKLQELFGLAETPKLGPTRVPVTMHLLAPNGRPVQTTRDLRSFWERTYPEVRRELRGRYPNHPWPEDPWRATPTHRTTRRTGEIKQEDKK